MRIKLFIILLFVSSICYAETRTSNYIQTTDEYSPVFDVTPSKGETVTDPNFGNVTKRITNVADLPETTQGNQVCLRSSQATLFSTENSTGEYIMVESCSGSTVHIYKKSDNSYITAVTRDGAALKQDESNGVSSSTLRWNPLADNPYRMYFAYKLVLYKIDDVVNHPDTIESVHDFTNDMTGELRVTTTDWDGEINYDCDRISVDAESPMISNDGTKFAFMCLDTETGGSYQPLAFLSYNMTTGDVYALEATDVGKEANTRFCSTNTISICPDGDCVMIHSSYGYATTCTYTNFLDTYMDGPHVFPFNFDITKYSTGTCAFTNGSATVECSGTSLLANAESGDYVNPRCDYSADYGSPAPDYSDVGNKNCLSHEIQSITDDDTFVMVTTYEGDTTLTSNYNISEYPVARVSPTPSHYGWGRDKSGNQVIVRQNSKNDWVQYSDMLGNWTNIYDDSIVGYPATHYGNMSYDLGKKGWIPISWYSNTNEPAYTNQQLLIYEIDDQANSPEFWRIGHKYANASSDECTGDCGEYHANWGFSGNNVCWGSNFNNQFDNDTANTSEVLCTYMPTNWLGTSNLTYTYDSEESSSISCSISGGLSISNLTLE